MMKHAPLLAALATTLMLGGCATAKMPTFGESLLKRSAEQQALAAKWSEGDKLIKRGTDNVEDGQAKVNRGQKLLDDGQKQLQQGKEQLAKGTQLKQEAEAGYLKLRANPLPLPGAVPAPVAEPAPAAEPAPVSAAAEAPAAPVEPTAAPAPAVQ